MEGSNGEFVDNPEVEQRLWRFEPVIFQELWPKMTLKRFVCNLDDQQNLDDDKLEKIYNDTTLSIDIEDSKMGDLKDSFEIFEKIPIEDAAMFFLKYRASVPSVADGNERQDAEQEVKKSLMNLKPELLQRRGWCSRILSIEEDNAQDVADRCSYTMNHCTDYKRWKFADKADFGCEDKNKSECLTAGYCALNGGNCEIIQTSKSVECLKEQENGEWDTVCEETHFDAYAGTSVAIGSVLISLLIMVSI